jgi:hypothetical protein
MVPGTEHGQQVKQPSHLHLDVEVREAGICVVPDRHWEHLYHRPASRGGPLLLRARHDWRPDALEQRGIRLEAGEDGAKAGKRSNLRGRTRP